MATSPPASNEQEDSASATVEKWSQERTDTDHGDKSLNNFIRSLMAAGSWCKNTAVSILGSIRGFVRDIADIMDSVMKSAYDKVAEAIRKAEAWTRKNPEATRYLVTAVAIGIITIVTPVLLHTLGFGKGGIIAGSWAANWQSQLAG